MNWLVAGWIGLIATAGPDDRTSKGGPVVLTGEVVGLVAELKARGVAADPEPLTGQVAVRADDGTITPLLSDEASRALFQDERLRNRPAEIRGQRIGGLPYVRVISFKVEDRGELRTPEYFCDLCKIGMRYSPGACPCCQGEMRLRMLPESSSNGP